MKPGKQKSFKKYSTNTNTSPKWKTSKKPYQNYYKRKNIVPIVPTKNNWLDGTFTLDPKTMEITWNPPTK